MQIMKKIFLVPALLVFGLNLFAQIDRSVAPKPQPNPEIKITIPDAITMPNGMKVIVVENHKLPVVSFQLFIDYPTLAEGNKSGMRDIFGQLLGSGTTNYNKDAFDAKIDYIGATLYPNARGFYASSLKKHTPTLLALLSDMVMNPTFPQDEFDRIKEQSLSNLETVVTDPDAISGNVTGVVNYGSEHPYGEVTTKESINNISLDDIKAYYASHFIPNYAYLVIVGDVTQQEAKGYVDTYFAAWKKGTDLKTPIYSLPTATGNNLYFVDKPGAVQSVINVTHTVKLEPGHPDEIPLNVLNAILGGGSFSARLMANLREDKAYTYGAYSDISSDKLIGSFSAGGSFRNEVTDSALTQILWEIERISSSPVEDKELELVKNSMTGAFARSLESPQTVAQFALNTIRFNLPKDYYSNYLMNLGKVTKEDISRVAALYLRPKNLNIIVVGNQEISGKLAAFDADNAVHYKDWSGKDKAQLKSAGEGVTAETIIKGYAFKSFMVADQAAYDAKLAKIGMIKTTFTAHVPEMDGSMIMTTWEGKPNKSATMMKIESSQMNAIVQKEWFNGITGGTFAMGQGKTTYEGDELADKMKPSFPYAQLYYLDDANMDVELLGIDELDGKEYYKIKIAKKGDTEFTYEYYGVESGMLEKRETFVTAEDGSVSSVMITYGDFKDMGKGLLMPHTMELNAQGQVFKFKAQEIVVKKKAKAKAFEGVFD
jgi:zinc protease